MSRLILLGLVWAALSAATAYFADLWGRRLGKQRKSLFGWRPKQTAVFMITSAGALIALLSFAVLLVANAGIRKALLQWDQTVEQVEASNVAMANLNRQMQEMQRATTDQRERLAAAQTARAEGEEALASAQASLLVQRQRVAVAQRSVQDIERRLRAEQATLASTSQELRAKERALSNTERSLVARQKELREAERQLKNAERVVFTAGAQALKADAEAMQAKRIAEQALLGNLAVRRDEELVRRVVPPRRTIHEAREAVQRALLDASVVVQRRSEERGIAYPRGTRDFVRLTRKTVVTSGSEGLQQSSFTEEQVRTAVAEQLMAPNSPSPGGVVLQVVATTNATAGERVTVDFRLYENHVVFMRDEVITRFVVTSDETREQVMQDITSAMQDVRREALLKGLLPTADNTVTALSVFQLAETYNRVMDALARDQSRVPVVVMAESDTWTAGPLRLRILVRRSEDEA